MGKLGVIKRLCVRFSDGRSYWIPARFIAEHRAKYYAGLDSVQDGADFQEVFETEVELALGDSFELQDWARNNMNWSDVPRAKRTRMSDIESRADLNGEWANAYMWVEYAPKQTDADKAMEELFGL